MGNGIANHVGFLESLPADVRDMLNIATISTDDMHGNVIMADVLAARTFQRAMNHTDPESKGERAALDLAVKATRSAADIKKGYLAYKLKVDPPAPRPDPVTSTIRPIGIDFQVAMITDEEKAARLEILQSINTHDSDPEIDVGHDGSVILPTRIDDLLVAEPPEEQVAYYPPPPRPTESMFDPTPSGGRKKGNVRVARRKVSDDD